MEYVLITLIVLLLPLAGMAAIVLILCHRDKLIKQIILDAIHQGLRSY